MEQILERLHAFGEFEVWLGNRPPFRADYRLCFLSLTNSVLVEMNKLGTMIEEINKVLRNAYLRWLGDWG